MPPGLTLPVRYSAGIRRSFSVRSSRARASRFPLAVLIVGVLELAFPARLCPPGTRRSIQSKIAWRTSKEACTARFRDPAMPAWTVRVSLADKLHNARAILFDFRAGHDVFGGFSADRFQQGWCCSALVDALAGLTDSPMMLELRRVVRELFGDDQGANAIVAPSSISKP